MTEFHRAHGLFRAVVFPTAMSLLLLAAIVGAVLDFSTKESDEIALGRQSQRVQVAIDQGLRQVSVNQEASTYWDDAVIRMRQSPLDLDWIDDNLGIWFHTYYHIDEVYLLDPGNRPVYAMEGGRRAPSGAFSHVAGQALDLARELRLRLRAGRLNQAGSTEHTVGLSELTLIQGHPALVSLKPILSASGKIAQAPGSEYLHVAIRYLDGDFLARLASVYSIEDPRFGSKDVAYRSLPILARDGKVLGYISWNPFEPGKQVADRMLPVLVSSFLVVGALAALLLLRIWRSRTELEDSREHAQRLAFHDVLTGLPNRGLFEERLTHALSKRGAQLAVLMLDLDRFKNVNDTLGHQAGDRLICEFGTRLKSLTRSGDTIARLGGDEFAILIENASLPDVERLANRIIDEVKRPFEISGAQVYVGTSIGIAVAISANADPLELVREADIALYSAKDDGRCTYRLFSPQMDDNLRRRRRIEDELRGALVTGEDLALHYQPQVSSDGSIVGLEALLRWDHETRGSIAPSEFIPVAEETGLIIPLGEWVLREACLASRQWKDRFVAVNLSPVQFRAPGFVDNLMAIVRDTGAVPARLQLEVTERVLLDDEDSIRLIMARLRAAGFKIVLDDFGTGYSSLSYLRRFQVDKIKIDGSFVQHLCDEPDSATIVTAVLALGWAMGLTVAAEGVETAEQCTFLESAGCQEMQGHYFSRPLPRHEVEALFDDVRFSSAA